MREGEGVQPSSRHRIRNELSSKTEVRRPAHYQEKKTCLKYRRVESND
jgi:hypothetical protein